MSMSDEIDLLREENLRLKQVIAKLNQDNVYLVNQLFNQAVQVQNYKRLYNSPKLEKQKSFWEKLFG